MTINLPPAYRPATSFRVVELALELFRLMPGRPLMPTVPSKSWQYRFCKEIAEEVIAQQMSFKPKRRVA